MREHGRAGVSSGWRAVEEHEWMGVPVLTSGGQQALDGSNSDTRRRRPRDSPGEVGRHEGEAWRQPRWVRT